MVRPFKYFTCDWSLSKNLIVGVPADPYTINRHLQTEKLKYKIYGVIWDHSQTLKELNKTDDINQFDQLVYKIKKECNN